MDQPLHDSSSFEYAFSVAQQRHKETIDELHSLREELRARDDVIKRLRASLGDRFDAELENRLLKDQLKKLEEGLQKVVLEDKRHQHEVEMPVSDKSMQVDAGAAISGEAVRPLRRFSENHVVKLSLEYLADILSFLDRFSLDRAEFTCPKLCAAVATLNGQNLRDVSRLDVTGPAYDKKGHFQRHVLAPNAITIIVECSSDPTALKTGATGANGELTWHFVDPPTATPHFAGLLRNASVEQLSLTGLSSHQFIQALSTAAMDVVIGSLAVGSFTPEAANLAVGRDALMSFNRLGKLAIATRRTICSATTSSWRPRRSA